MMNIAVTYFVTAGIPRLALTFSTCWGMDLLCPVIVNVCLANDDVYLKRGVTKMKMPRSAVKHYWLSPSVDAFLKDA